MSCETCEGRQPLRDITRLALSGAHTHPLESCMREGAPTMSVTNIVKAPANVVKATANGKVGVLRAWLSSDAADVNAAKQSW